MMAVGDSGQMRQPGPDAGRMGRPTAMIMGWLLLAFVNTPFIAMWATGNTGWAKTQHHLYDLGHMLALGLVCAVGSAGHWSRCVGRDAVRCG